VTSRRNGRGLLYYKNPFGRQGVGFGVTGTAEIVLRLLATEKISADDVARVQNSS
jgi:hypothetical protein